MTTPNYYEAWFEGEDLPIKLFGCQDEAGARGYAHRIRPNQILIKMELVEDD